MIFILNYDYNIIFDLNLSLCLLSQFYHTFLIGHLSSFLSQFPMQGKIYKKVILKFFYTDIGKYKITIHNFGSKTNHCW